MHAGKLVFAQLIGHLPLHTFRQCVAKYPSRYPTLKFSHLDQFLCLAFAQLTCRESLRDIETCLRAHQAKLYHLGIRGNIARSTLADANESRDWHIYQDFALSQIKVARKLYAQDDFAVELEQTVYALDTTTIDLCLSVFPWARFRSTKAAVKMHTLLDLRGNIPSFIHISDGKMHEVNVLDLLIPEAGSFRLKAMLRGRTLSTFNQKTKLMTKQRIPAQTHPETSACISSQLNVICKFCVPSTPFSNKLLTQ